MLEVTLAYDLSGETKASRSWETQVRLTEGETSMLDVSLAEGPPQTLLITGSRDEDTANLEFELKRGEGQAASEALAVADHLGGEPVATLGAAGEAEAANSLVEQQQRAARARARLHVP